MDAPFWSLSDDDDDNDDGNERETAGWAFWVWVGAFLGPEAIIMNGILFAAGTLPS